MSVIIIHKFLPYVNNLFLQNGFRRNVRLPSFFTLLLRYRKTVRRAAGCVRMICGSFWETGVQSFLRATSAMSGQRLMMYCTALRLCGTMQSVQFLTPVSV